MKFIHIGRIKIITIKLFLLLEYLRRISASGKDSTRHIPVTRSDIPILRKNGFPLTGSRIAATLASVKDPSDAVNALYTSNISGTTVNRSIHIRYGPARSFLPIVLRMSFYYF